MCGIVGYIGSQNGIPIAIEGLKRLEYRGYDSAGLCYFKSNKLYIKKKKGKVSDLEQSINKNHFANIIMGHTRWATHGRPSNINAHPHISMNQKLAIVHNGIIENYYSLKEGLIHKGYSFQSDTDTEVLINLIEYIYGDVDLSLIEAIQQTLTQVVGAFSIAVMSLEDPNSIIVAKKGSPLVIGVGQEEHYIASDPSPFLKYTKKAIYLDDGEIAEISNNSLSIFTIDKKIKSPIIKQLTMELAEIEKGGYETFMLKEIYEQPKSIVDTLRGRILGKSQTIKLRGFNESIESFKQAKRIIIVGCGTSWLAGLVAEYVIEGLAKLPVEVEYASEFRYRDPVIYKNDIVIAFSQSGETADTLSALKLAQEKGALVYGICNVVGSSISRLVNVGTFTHAGPEIGVASTKAFTAQLTVLLMLSLKIGRRKGVSKNRGKELVRALRNVDKNVSIILQNIEEIKNVANATSSVNNYLYLGRGVNFPVALEGALKLKEISYIHAEGYPAAEMKHGPIALIDKDMPVVFIAPQDDTFSKILTNIEEVKARGGIIITITDKVNSGIEKLSDFVLITPKTHKYVFPITCSVILQILAYELAVKRGCEIDQPRNLAKSVTVE